MWRRLIRLFNLLFFLLFAFSLQAETEKVTVIFEHNPPFQMSDKKGSGYGPIIDFAKVLLKEANLEAEFILLPWARIIQKETYVANNLILSISKTLHRRDNYIWVTKVYSGQQFIWRLKGVRGSSDSVGVERNSYKIPFLRAHFGDNNVVEYLDTDQAVVAMFKGNIDHYVGSTIAMKNKLERLGLDFSKVEIEDTFNFSSNEGLHLAMTKGTSKHILDKIMSALNKAQTKQALSSLSNAFAAHDKPFLAQKTLNKAH